MCHADATSVLPINPYGRMSMKILLIVYLQYISIFRHVPQRPSVWRWTTFITTSSFLELFKLFLRSNTKKKKFGWNASTFLHFV